MIRKELGFFSEAIHLHLYLQGFMDCFVATLLAMTKKCYTLQVILV